MEPKTGYVLRVMADLEVYPDAYPQPFRIMWDKAAAITELCRLSREESHDGLTYGMIECPADAE